MTSHNETEEGQQCSNTAHVNDTNHPNIRRHLKVLLTVLLNVVSISLLILLIETVYNLESYTPMPCHVSANVSYGTASALKSDDNFPHTDYVCSFNTSEHFLETLTDDLSEYCKPKAQTRGIFNADMHQCSDNKLYKLYIPRQCLCDSKQQCPGEKDISRKQKCKTCSDKRHCPCQYGAICSKCQYGSSSGDKVECLCKQGTSGKYCTKITQRTCRQHKTITNIPHCNNSNAFVCFIQEPRNNEHYLCQWSGSGKDNDMRKEGTNLKTSKTLLKIALALNTLNIVIIICVLLQLCRKRASSTSQI